ncbi:protein kinase [Sphaerospermopsis aphanizomenoides BCCUSP55]|uniref:serine/threonine protein kinase n=1 Tax=Sphaerospermopsis aphanizomenoides TaxID=459663 RepID=UPI001905DEC1|nr:serine/threonine-protein kinase [Sphaerospermopsis aphanizomenoides]MBK1988111.1 protein kinase [Sphaerospermopsis aphanizomenoides BCCUSP55]
MVWLSGQQLQNGKYTIEKKLGHGGFGITYLAKDKKGNPVVIKTLKDTDVDSDDFDKCLQDFINEAIKLAKCSHHPHIVKIYECIKEGDIWGMVMEYIKGEDLGILVRNHGILSEDLALNYIQQIGEALTVVHSNGFLHRDIKPQNIMIRSGKSEAVLIDFGIARDFTPNLTQTHTTHKTLFYAPPEQYNPRAKRGAFTDVYALAATLYKVLTGKEPEGAVSRTMGEPLAPPNKLNPNISDRVNRAILKGLELKSEKRPQSVQDWLKLLKIPDEIVSYILETENRSKFIELLSKCTEETLKVINLAYRETSLLGHKFIGAESILLGLINANTGLAASALKNNGVTLENSRLEVEKIVGRGSGVRIEEVQFTPRAVRVLELSHQLSIPMMNERIFPEHLLLALLSEGEGVAIRVLENLGVELSKLENFILENIEP